MSVALEVSNLDGPNFGSGPLFSSLCISIIANRVLFVTGPSGCGKSSLLRLLASLDPISANKLRCASLASDPLQNAPAWRTEVAYIPQARVTRTGSPRDLFQLALTFKAQKARSSKLKESLDEVSGKIGISSDLLDQPWSTLSGGQAQRSILAIFLALNPSVLLCDEITSALDAENSILVEKELQKRTCVWISHDLHQVDRVVGANWFEFPKNEGKEIENDENSPLLIGSINAVSKEIDSTQKNVNKKVETKKSSSKWMATCGIVFVTLLLLLWQYFNWPGYQYLKSDTAPGQAVAPKAITVELVAGTYLSLLIVCIGVSNFWGLALESDVIVSASRALIQLTILGFVLVPIFIVDSPWLVLAYLTISTIVSSFEAVKRCKYVYPFLASHVLLAISVSAAVVASAGLIALGEDLHAQYAIPMCGMILGNMITGISLALNVLLTELGENGRNTELLLCLGANRWEAAREVISRAISVGLTPTVQGMAVLGLVAIPGMMTGQILGGTVPEQAARYQLLISSVIAIGSVVSMVFVTVLAASYVIDAKHLLRVDRLFSKAKTNISYKKLLFG